MANATVYGIGDASVDANSPLSGTKTVHRYRESFAIGRTVTAVAAEYGFNIATKSGTFKKLSAMITGTIATGGDRTVTIDLLKSTGAAAYASVLSATLVLNSSSTLRSATSATISDTSISAGDSFVVTVAVAGAAGAQAIGYTITVEMEENP